MTFLRDERIPPVPKEVQELQKDGEFPVVKGVDITLFAESIADIRERIENGTPLPPNRYRQGTQRDLLLEQEGYMHLHVDPGVDNDVLLLVGQTDDTVVFLGLVRHSDLFDPPKYASGTKKWLSRPLAEMRMRWRMAKKPEE